MIRFFLCVASILHLAGLSAQSVTGLVSNENGDPVPFATIFIQELGEGTTADENGSYRYQFDLEGSYRLIVSSLGYTTTKSTVVVRAEDVEHNIRIVSSEVQLEEITVKANARDPAYGIMRNVVKNKAKHLKAADSYRTKIYVKAVEEIDRKKKVRKQTPPPIDEEEAAVPDPFAEAEKAKKKLLSSLNLLEMELVLNFQQPRNYKEERLAVDKYGNTKGLFIPNFGETDFNFYRNMVALTGISDAPVISPFSNTGVLSYKYELQQTTLEGEQIVYEIKVIPRKEGNSTANGTVWVNEGSWTINRIDLSFSKYALKFFDAFRLQQSYSEVAPGLWTVISQSFIYTAKQGKRLTFNGRTTLSYSEYEHNFSFPAKFFGNEIAVTTKEAYERDSSYWQGSRTVELTREEAKLIQLRDSIEAVHSSEAYQDSIQEQYNKIKILEVLWDGMGFVNNQKKRHVYVGSLAGFLDFSPVGGWRLGPYVSYDRRFPSGQRMSLSGTANVGIQNEDLQGNFSAWYRYNPFKLGDISISGGRSFESINQYDAYLNQLRPSNYIFLDAVRVGHRIELVNGLFVSTDLSYNSRKPINLADPESFLAEVVTDEEGLLEFEPYEATILTNVISYTPGLKYLREPDRKIRLGSKWPTLSLMYRKGVDGLFGSDIDFDYLRLFIDQDIILGTLGTMHYEGRVGKFVNTKDLRFVDFKRFRQSDPILFSDPTNSFQVLDTALTTSNMYLEFHVIHHFNGALINNIPLLKKSRIKTVVGGGVMYLPTESFRHQEVFAGIERVFKIGARRRLRVGTYAVLGDSNLTKPRSAFKISFDLIDLWKRDWSF